MTDLTIEDRVAALERILTPPAQIWTAEQAGQFCAEWDRLMRDDVAGFRKYEVRLLPPAPVLTPETARALLAECVTVVKPGETLIIRAPDTWTPEQVHVYQEYADAATREGRVPFPVLVVLGDELGVFRPGLPLAEGEAREPRHWDYPVGGPGCPGCAADREAAADPFADKAAQRGGYRRQAGRGRGQQLA